MTATNLIKAVIPKMAGKELDRPDWTLTDTIQLLPTALLKPDSRNPRGPILDQDVTDILTTIPIDGIREPIVIRKAENGDAVILSGHRRHKGAEIAGVPKVPCLLYNKNIDDAEALRLLIVYNMHRKDVRPIQTAMAYQKLMDEKKINQTQVARELSIPQSEVSNYLSLLTLSEELQKYVNAGSIKVSEAFVLARQDKSMADSMARSILFGHGSPLSTSNFPTFTGSSPTENGTHRAPGDLENNKNLPTTYSDPVTGIIIRVLNPRRKSASEVKEAITRIKDSIG